MTEHQFLSLLKLAAYTLLFYFVCVNAALALAAP
jgi:hypothetical protein